MIRYALIWIANHGGLGLRAGGGWGGNAPSRERSAMPGLDIAWLLIVLQLVAMDQIGNIYALGGNGVVQSYSKAVAWYLKGAQAGSGAAMYNIGHLYQHGRGVPHWTYWANYMLAGTCSCLGRFFHRR